MKLSFFTMLLIMLSTTLFAQAQNDFSYFKPYAGDYKSYDVLEDKKLKPILKKILGKEYQHFVSNLDVIGSVDLISGGIVLEGNASHGGGEEMAKLDVNLYTWNSDCRDFFEREDRCLHG